MVQTLEGKVALVTGASRGIGQKIAETLASAGAKVVVNYASSPAKAEEVVNGIRQSGGEAIAVQADIGKVSEVERLFDETLRAYGRLDILVNNAGVLATKPLTSITEEDFDKHFAINVKGTFFAIQQAARVMSENGRIINFSTSIVGMMLPTYSLYAGTKGAVEQFTRHLAKELGPKKITVNAIAPGPVNTELFTAGKSEEQIRMYASMNAFGRLGETEDITKVVLFLASDESQWINGQTIRANGGSI
ncbi:SDR family oxidoreductase [Paenibacillus beijingensis]|uniref:3-ketoacyl-ACP reductase n=1 Tax=Paenibacillus beijingensis TaxID=1126833 RepID=A0A0D5NH47_9BACL|nr:SDR family oxidoreductase [Paenibacillus beijingensis]AJY74282.1 3-ketoacyl-ACP reductase [Paenibacillus beijingensis]